MNWNDILARVDGVLTVVDAPPVCERCVNGKVQIVHPGTMGWEADCPTCDGTGTQWHWRVQPTAGMLVAMPEGPHGRHWGRLCYYPNGIGQLYHCYAGSCGCDDGWFDNWDAMIRPGEHPSLDFSPLLPPPLPGCTALELLALIGVAEGGYLYVEHRTVSGSTLVVATSHFYPNGGSPAFATRERLQTDTAPLRLALQHHDALCAWLAGAK
jgi:hypothetical protein